jgi:Fe-S cluster biogenesis protein NfuA
MLASHGGYTTLDHVEGDVAYMFMGGGCQGCGLAKLTLTEGIKATIEREIDEIREVDRHHRPHRRREPLLRVGEVAPQHHVDARHRAPERAIAPPGRGRALQPASRRVSAWQPLR